MKRKEQYADEIIEMLERTKCGAWASNINLNTKDRVIEVCQNVVDSWSGRKFKDHCTTLPQALEQEPYEDCISRAEAQTEIEMNASRYTIARERGGMGQVEWSDQLIKVSDAVDTIRHLHSVTPKEPKTGHWIEEDVFDGDVAYRCSECDELFWLESGTPKDNEYNFCPKCGTKMVEPQERSDKEC